MYKKCNVVMLQTEDQLAPIILGVNLLVNLPPNNQRGLLTLRPLTSLS